MTTLPNKFTTAYIECALWSSTGDDGEPLDKDYALSDIAPETLARMVSDCADFQRDNADALTESGLSDSRAGSCFWLNRNGHGSGFWDEGQDPVFRKLSDACKVWGTFDLNQWGAPLIEGGLPSGCGGASRVYVFAQYPSGNPVETV